MPVSRAAWVCDSCHTNNLADAAICRLCQRAPGSATGRVEAVTHMEVAIRPEQRPTFVQSRHTELPRPAITLAPVPPPARPRLPRPPAPSPPPMRPPTSRRTGRRLVKLVLSGAAVIVLLTNLDELGELLPDLSPPGQEETSAAGPATPGCPGVAAQWLPQGGPGSTLVAMYESTDHVVTVCQDTGGQSYYDGQKKGVEASDTTHIALTATQTATGFTADNGDTRYEINGLSLTITTNGVLQYQWPLTQVAP